MILEPGSILGGYRLVKLVGRGGMGTVWKAEDPALDRFVAVKVLHEKLRDAEKARMRFLREPVAMGRLSHPNIVGIHQLHTDAEPPWFAMDYVDGDSLDKFTGEGFRLPPRRALGILIQLADALDHAHRNGVIHRDVKPANVLLAAGDRSALTDFSVARVDTWTRKSAADGPLAALREFDAHDTPHEKLAGTPACVPPERWLQQEYDGRADIYGFGVMMFQLLTGALPFDGPEMKDIRGQHLRGLAPKLPAGTPEPVAAIVLRCLRKSPQNRFHDAAELREELKFALRRLEEAEAAPRPAQQQTANPPAAAFGTVGFPVFTAPPRPASGLQPLIRWGSIFVLAAVLAAALFVMPVVLMKKLASQMKSGATVDGGIGTRIPGVALDEEFNDNLLERRFRVAGRVTEFSGSKEGAWIGVDTGGETIFLWCPSARGPLKKGESVSARGILVKSRDPNMPEYFIYVEKESDIDSAGRKHGGK